MGCMGSAPRVNVVPTPSVPWSGAPAKNESVAAALARIDAQIESSEKSRPAARLAVVSAEMDSILQEIRTFEETTSSASATKESYARTIHQLFSSLDLYRRPVLAADNEDFIANVNRKEMRRLELSWLKNRYEELQRERRVLHAQILRTRALYARVDQLLESVWSNSVRPGTNLEAKLSRATALRDALASVSARLRAAAEYAHSAARLLDDALPAWKLTSVGKSGWERTLACADACRLLVHARCAERGARRVLSASAAPRAARALRLVLDYAFTDALHDHKYQRATEVFMHFKDAVVQLISSIHQKRYQETKPSQNVDMFINGKPVCVPSYFTVLQALRRERIVLPSFCYHERLSIAGNCRMCIVEVEGMWKMQIACATPVAKGMNVRTNSPKTLAAQEGVVELILLDHPLDCPICDQGGECDLQDISMKFGNDRTRFTDLHFDGKRAVENKDLGPFIRAVMNRCIHCTRCIRFGSQVAGIDVLGSTGRGHQMLVGAFVNKMFLSELSGNIIDLCPVGALTSIPYMFKARPWENYRTNSIDVTDATGTNICLNYRYDRVIRILPREHDEINQEWVSDKGRWSMDSLEMQRLVTPLIANNGCLQPVEWEVALPIAADYIRSGGASIAAVAGPHTNVETLVACKDFLNCLGSQRLYVLPDMFHSLTRTPDMRQTYSLNVAMKDIPEADVIVLVGTNPRFEAPILNVWIRQAYRANDCDIYVVGPEAEYNYFVCYAGDSAASIGSLCAKITCAKKPLIFIGMASLATDCACAVYECAMQFERGCPNWPVVNFVPTDASFCGALEVGYRQCGLSCVSAYPPATLILLGCDGLLDCWKPPTTTNVMYIGFQGDIGAQYSRVILPGVAFTECVGTYMNMETRSQLAQAAVTPPGKAREDWKIIRALSEYCRVKLPYDDHACLQHRMDEISPALVAYDQRQPKCFTGLECTTVGGNACGGLPVPLKTLEDYFLTDVYTCNSPCMVQGAQAAKEYKNSPYYRN